MEISPPSTSWLADHRLTVGLWPKLWPPVEQEPTRKLAHSCAEARRHLAAASVLDLLPPRVRDEDQVLSEAKARHRAACRRLTGYGSSDTGPTRTSPLACRLWQHERDARWRGGRWAPVLAGWSAEDCLEVAMRGDLAILRLDFRALSRNPYEGSTPKCPKVRLYVGVVPHDVANAAAVRDQLARRAETTGVHERVVIDTPEATFVVVPPELLPGSGGRRPRVDLSGLVEVDPALAAWWMFLVLTSGQVTKARGEGAWAEPRRDGDPRLGTRADRTVVKAYFDIIDTLDSSGVWAVWDPVSGWDEALDKVEGTLAEDATEVVGRAVTKSDGQISDEDLLALIGEWFEDWLDDAVTAPGLVKVALHRLGVARCRGCGALVGDDHERDGCHSDSTPGTTVEVR